MAHLILDLDVGNTFTKWRCGAERGQNLGLLLPQLEDAIHRVRISNVGANEQRLTDLVTEQYGVDPEFAKSQATCSGVSNGYEIPTQLGVDRWLAIVAAWNQTKRPCLVIDAGTALTLDAVNSQGQHLGGYIVPGFRSCMSALTGNTQDVKVSTPLDLTTNLALGKSTEETVHRGVLRMLIGLIDQTKQNLATQLAQPIQLLLCGGDASVLQPCLSVDTRLVPDLVLHGLEYVLP